MDPKEGVTVPNFAAIKLLRGAASVVRVHTRRTIHRQTVGEHTFGALGLLLHIEENPSLDVIRALLYHDVPEFISGDVPSPTKKQYPELRRILEDIEQKVLRGHGLDTDLSPRDQRLLDYCDIMELAMFASEEIDMGNQLMAVVLRRCMVALVSRDLIGVTPTALELYKQIEARSSQYPPRLGESSLYHLDD
jgi:hypothetical protein